MKLRALIQEYNNFSSKEKLFLLFSMLVGFCIASEYAITRPPCTAIFLSYFSSKAIPWIWLISVPFNLSVIYTYNHFLPRIGPLRMLGVISVLVVCMNLLCFVFLPNFPEYIAIQFLWKDVYILLMFKQLWSMVHSTILASRAQYLYGMIFFMGTLGSICGSLIPSFFAVELGSQSLFLCTAPIYIGLFYCYFQAYRRSALTQQVFSQDPTIQLHPREAFSLIRRSKYLFVILLLVVLMQVSVGLMDYQFNIHLEKNIVGQDLRTAYCGRLVGFTNMLSGMFQLVGGIVLIRLFGIKGSHLMIPIVLLGNALLIWVIPSFAVVSFGYVFLKSIDFSIFAVIREMLYIPLKLDEKFRAKALIDVFAYRSSKAIVSLCILLFQTIGIGQVVHFAGILSFLVFFVWIGVVAFGLKKYMPDLQLALSINKK